jgi:multicomponent Na+:H+ antiporter subunit F
MIFVLFFMTFCVLLMLFMLLISKTISEKAMSLGCVTNYVVVLLCIMSAGEGRESFVDIAYIYALLGFITNLCLTKLHED